MADIADIAAERQEIEEARFYAAREQARQTGPSLEECEECGVDIPEARREAVKGCQLCVDCAEIAERGKRRG